MKRSWGSHFAKNGARVSIMQFSGKSGTKKQSGYDPVLYHCEYFEFSQVDVVNFRPLELETQNDLENGLENNDLEADILGDNDFTDKESKILDDPSVIHRGYLDEYGYSDEFCTVEVNESVMDEPSQLYTKPYINLKIDWMRKFAIFKKNDLEHIPVANL